MQPWEACLAALLECAYVSVLQSDEGLLVEAKWEDGASHAVYVPAVDPPDVAVATLNAAAEALAGWRHRQGRDRRLEALGLAMSVNLDDWWRCRHKFPLKAV